MARPSRASTARYPRLSRNSALFTTPDTNTQATTGREAANPDPYAQEQQDILNLLPEGDVGPPDSANLDFTEFIGDESLDEDGQVCFDYVDERGNTQTFRVPLSDLKDLSARGLAKVTAAQHAGIYAVIQKIKHEFRQVLVENSVLRQANDLNRKKFEDAANKAIDYKSRKDDWYRKCKSAEAESVSLQAQVNTLEAEQELNPSAEDYNHLKQRLQELTAQLGKGGSLGRGRSRRRSRHSSESRSRARRERGGHPPDDEGPGESDRSRSRSRSRRRRKDAAKKKQIEGQRQGFPIDLDSDDKLGQPDNDVVVYNPSLGEALKTSRTIPDPDKFSGTSDTLAFDEWTDSLANKFSVTTFRDVPTALHYVLSRTTGTAHGMIKPSIPSIMKLRGSAEYADGHFSSVRECLQSLQDHFGEYDVVGNAQYEMDRLTMGSSDKFSDFYPKFQKINAYLPKVTGPAGQKTETHKLYAKLSAKYKNALRLHDYSTMPKLIKLCQKLQQENAVMDDLHPRQNQASDKANKKTPNQASNKAPEPPAVGATTTGLKAWKDRPEEFRSLPKMTPELKLQLDAENKCRRCRRAGHTPNDSICPLSEYEKLPTFRVKTEPNASASTPAGNA